MNRDVGEVGPKGLARKLALVSLRGFETPVAGKYMPPPWATSGEIATLPPAFETRASVLQRSKTPTFDQGKAKIIGPKRDNHLGWRILSEEIAEMMRQGRPFFLAGRNSDAMDFVAKRLGVSTYVNSANNQRPTLCCDFNGMTLTSGNGTFACKVIGGK